MRKDIPNNQEKYKIPFFVLLAILLVVLITVIIIVISNASNRDKDEPSTSAVSNSTEKWQEGVIKYNGKYYQYNNKIKTYLLMGIDKETSQTEDVGASDGGQSDAMFLLVADSSKEKVSVISINRNSMTDIDVYDESGTIERTLKAQICTQHGFGDGKHLSCSRATDAVSGLFYNIPIQGYLSIRMGGIPIMNDAIGGVKLTVLQDVLYPAKGVNLVAGEVKTLTGNEAYCYLRGRQQSDFDSATDRLRRQEQYITCFIDQMKAYTAGSTSKIISIYDSIEDYIVTNLDFPKLASDFSAYEFDAENMYTVPGETIMGDEFEEYHVDDNALYDMIIEVFYNEVSEE